jgi:hypothetical protein
MSEQIIGIVVRINRDKHIVTVRSGSEDFLICGDGRIKDAPGGHGCLVNVDDLLTFERPTSGKTVHRAFFVHPPEAILADEEVSIVSSIAGGLVFGLRQIPSCGCSILLGSESRHPELSVGDLVRHGLGLDPVGKPRATNVIRLKPAIATKEDYEPTT